MLATVSGGQVAHAAADVSTFLGSAVHVFREMFRVVSGSVRDAEEMFMAVMPKTPLVITVTLGTATGMPSGLGPVRLVMGC